MYALVPGLAMPETGLFRGGAGACVPCLPLLEAMPDGRPAGDGAVPVHGAVLPASRILSIPDPP